MQVEMTCTAELDADLGYDFLVADYNLHKDKTNPGMKAAYLMSEKSKDNYKALEKLGMLTIFRATHDNQLIGLINVMDCPGGEVAMVESMYVLEDMRATGAGNALYSAVKSFCRARGNKAIIMSAAPQSVLDKRLTRLGSPVISKLFYIEL